MLHLQFSFADFALAFNYCELSVAGRAKVLSFDIIYLTIAKSTPAALLCQHNPCNSTKSARLLLASIDKTLIH
jgi:hypothetical protein